MSLKLFDKSKRKTLVAVFAVLLLFVSIALISKYAGLSPTGALIATINVGTEKYVDADGDGSNDLKITVTKALAQSSVEIKITKLRAAKPVAESISPETAAPAIEEQAPEEKAPTAAVPAVTLPAKGLTLTSLLAPIIAIILVIAGAYWYYTRKSG